MGESLQLSAKACGQAVTHPAAALRLHNNINSVASVLTGQKAKTLASLPAVSRAFEKLSLKQDWEKNRLPPKLVQHVILLGLFPQSDALKEALLYRTPVNNLEASFAPVTTYGAEFEFFGLEENTLGHMEAMADALDSRWLRTRDQTIKPDDGTEGVEMVSPVCKKTQATQIYFMALILEALRAKTPLPCAFHIHAGIDNSFKKNLRHPLLQQVLLNYIALEPDLEFLDSVLTHPYVTPYRTREQAFSRVLIASDYDINHMIRCFNINDRQKSKINFEPLKIYGTIEFRQHPGTVNPAEATAWTAFIDALLRQSLNMIGHGKRSPHAPDENELAVLKNLAAKLREDRARPPEPGPLALYRPDFTLSPR